MKELRQLFRNNRAWAERIVRSDASFFDRMDATMSEIDSTVPVTSRSA